MKPVDIKFTYDFICPWCWICHSHLKTALTQQPWDVALAIQYVPYELDPDMPKEGVNRKTYRSAKLGSWGRSQAMDSDVTLAGKRAGLEFNYDRVLAIPNTGMAHRLMHFAAGKGEAQKTETFFEAVFQAYFSKGKNIGDTEVLVELASQIGFCSQEVRSYLSNQTGEREVVAAGLQAQANSERSIPTVRIGETLVSGAQPAAVFAQALQQATASLTS
ncbi:hypothetical protein DJFAAGMI_00285 [Comamonas sp. PE63]|uniref:DSBA-like thioredoxin domain-containing protein n=1 Tax=Comamonas brasiliensis TaxID=1812482 RepID=A0ABS5LM53_9BURK|nr:DsbA family oxidoreductase [Comamonas sp. PE63]MBS3017566.1 hypothetical protein [Comamonas sp. PE63]